MRNIYIYIYTCIHVIFPLSCGSFTRTISGWLHPYFGNCIKHFFCDPFDFPFKSYHCAHTYIHTHIHACMHGCVHPYIHTSIHTSIHPYKHTNLHFPGYGPPLARTHGHAMGGVTVSWKPLPCVMWVGGEEVEHEVHKRNKQWMSSKKNLALDEW